MFVSILVAYMWSVATYEAFWAVGTELHHVVSVPRSIYGERATVLIAQRC